MRGFWWFEEGSIAGMARPGFNAIHWTDLPFDEGILLGWLGAYSSGPAPLSSFRDHLKTYAPKVLSFFKLEGEAAVEALECFGTPAGILEVTTRLARRTGAFKDFWIKDDLFYFDINKIRLSEEIEIFKSLGISKIITLTEHHHHKDLLGKHFELHHFAIKDLDAPTQSQALEMAQILRDSTKNQKVVAVHCLAGIGRTSTMLIAAHLLLGHGLDDLKIRIDRKNPSFIFAGPQANFINEVATWASSANSTM